MDYLAREIPTHHKPDSMALISDLPKQKLREIAAYLDRFPSTASRLDEEHIDQENEFWRLLIRALNRVDRSMCNYSSVQIETLAMESLNQKSPSLELLLNLQQMKDPPSLEVFVKCLKEIGCTKALNIFKSASKFIYLLGDWAVVFCFFLWIQALCVHVVV